MRVDELGLTQRTVCRLRQAGIHDTAELPDRRPAELLWLPELESGIELYELIRALHRRGCTPWVRKDGCIQTERELADSS